MFLLNLWLAEELMNQRLREAQCRAEFREMARQAASVQPSWATRLSQCLARGLGHLLISLGERITLLTAQKNVI